MTIGLSLVSYIGSTALIDYDADYAHWTQVQTLVRYLDEGGKANFAEDQAAKDRRLVITFPNAEASVQIDGNARNTRSASPSTDSTTNDPISLEIPAARVSRISELLIDADHGDGPPTYFGFSCSRLLELFARARGAKPTDPVPSGGLTSDECRGLMTKVKPHVLTVADDLALTFSSMSAERETLGQILKLLLFPVRVVDAAVLNPSVWAYHQLLHIAASGAQAGETAQIKPTTQLSPVPQTIPPNTEDAVRDPVDAFDLFVLLQQRNAPIPTILPIPSVKSLGMVFDARLAVAIANTYLLTLSFGFLGACVWVLREINARLEDFTLAPSRFARYRARILLGMVAGPTIGLFFDQEGRLLSFATSSTDVPSLSTQLSAVAIAFVAGFSIEILFAILDRFIRIIQEFAGVNGTHQPTTK